MEIATADARKMGLRDGDMVREISATDTEGVWDLGHGVKAPMQGKVRAMEGLRPIWNKEVTICYGIGKHGDSAKTRANKRSPWDIMHPGRKWAEDTTADRMQRHEMKAKVAKHFKKDPIVRHKEHVFKLLALE